MLHSFRRIRMPALMLGVLAILAASLVAPFAPRAAAQSLPAGWVKGFVTINYSADPYATHNVPAALADMAKTGADYVAFAPRWFMETARSTDITPVPERGTPSDESLIAAIQEARRLGLKVMLRPYFDVIDETWRADIEPPSIDAWFASYSNFINHYLDMSQAQGVSDFTLGVELINMTDPKYDSYWHTLIDQARARFKGQLTYSANWGKHTRNEFMQITWWDRLDYIGISAYFPIALNDNPTMDQMVSGWSDYVDQVGDRYNWISDLKAVADRFNKKIIFTEIGFGSYINSPARWDTTQKTWELSLDVQDRAVEATFRALSGQSWLGGLYWWHWEPYVGGGGANDASDTLNNKPAVATITRWFGGTGVAPNPNPNPNPNPSPDPSNVRPAPAPGQAGVNNPAFERVASPGPDTATSVYFDATGHTLQGGFLDYWRSNGGLPIFGYPISQEYWEISATDGKPYVVQYFERQRFEYHPEAPADSQILLGLLGVALVNGRTDGPFARVAETQGDGLTYFAPTGHTLRGGFKTYWERYGGLPIFGYPLSEEFQEVSATDGKPYVVQYFERARFEYHPEYAGTFNEVLLGFLGRWYAGR